MAQNSETTFPVKKLVRFTPEMVELIRDYRFAQRIASDSEAIRRLIAAGLSAAEPASPPPAKWRDAALSEIKELINDGNGDGD